MKEHTFRFTDGIYPCFGCDPAMPAALYDKLREAVKEFYKEDKR